MTFAQADGRFRYEGYGVDRETGCLTCGYSVGDRRFVERITLGPGRDWETSAAGEAARLVYLLAGVSYYKTAAPPVVDLGDLETTADERRFLRTFYTEGLAEYAYVNTLDLSGLEITGPDAGPVRAPADYRPEAGRPLVPFGGGIDSIVTQESVRARYPDLALFVVSRPRDRFDAIERPAGVSGLPVLRAEREVDPQLLRSAELGFLNGHVPVTGILSSIAVLAAVLDGRDAVVMSNERSASDGNLVIAGRTINHQWSKSFAFEKEFRSILAASFGPGLRYYSLLRPYSELWVAQRFSVLTRYHRAFRSCNRSFLIERSRRLDDWCGTCDKCCFIDLILSPFLPPDDLAAIFGGSEPLADPALEGRFRALLGNWPETKPFECVGDEDECRAAVLLGAERPDRAGTRTLQVLAAEMGPDPLSGGPGGDGPLHPADLLRPHGEHCIPDGDAPVDQLV
jgi:hypothetical protein